MEKTFTYQNKKIIYRCIGKGNPVVLLHGFGEDGGVWNNQVNFLKDKAMQIIPDLPGSGKSEMIDDMSIEGMAACMYALILHEKIEKFILLGHSMGGYISLAFAEKYPGMLNAFGLIHSTAYADSEEKKDVRDKAIKFIRQHGPFEFLKTTIPNLFSEITRKNNPQMVKEFISSLQYFKAEQLVSYYESMKQRPERTEVLKHIKKPVLFIAGTEDPAVPLKDSLSQCHLPEICYFHLFENSGHMSMLEEPEKLNFLLEKFLKDLD